MKEIITRINLYGLKNETHVQFNENVNSVIEKYQPAALGIEALYKLYKTAFGNELEAFDFISKNEITAKIAEQDYVRKSIYLGFYDSLKGACNHFNPDVCDGAQILLDTLKHYGNVAEKTFDNETAEINDILREIEHQPLLASALNTVCMREWVYKLEKENDAFNDLMNLYAETAQNTPLRMKPTRMETDRLYHAIVNQLENTVITGSENIDAFVLELNAIIERYKSIMKQARARKSKYED